MIAVIMTYGQGFMQKRSWFDLEFSEIPSRYDYHGFFFDLNFELNWKIPIIILMLKFEKFEIDREIPEFNLMIFVIKWLKFENFKFSEFILTIYFKKILTFQKLIEIITFEPKIMVQNAIFCIFTFGQNIH